MPETVRDGRLRVLVVTPDFPPSRGGIQTLMARLAELLPRCAVRVVTMPAPAAAEHDARTGLDVRRVTVGTGAPKLRIAPLAAGALWHAARMPADIVLVGHVAAFPAAAAIRRVLGKPAVLYVYADEFRAWPSLCRVAVRGADAVISISRHSEAMARAAGTPPERLHRIAPAVDHPPPSRDPARHPDPRPTVLTIARMAERYKGHDVMVRAVPLLVGRVPDARWVVVGDGPLRPSLEERAAAIGARDSVLFTGAISDEQRESWLWRARVFAMPSRLPPGGLGGEGFGIAYLEAAARGLPVVAGDEGGAVDAVDPGRSAYMVDPRDHVSVAEAIAGLLECQQAAHALGEAGRRWASKFTWPATAARVAEVLRSVAARGAGS